MSPKGNLIFSLLFVIGADIGFSILHYYINTSHLSLVLITSLPILNSLLVGLAIQVKRESQQLTKSVGMENKT